MEPVRMVVWDLDETFWRGTLSEGGIEYQEHLHETVIELAQRGIMSSICSKNDFQAVKKILVEKGIWDYFIFPSIDWQAKGLRLKALIEQVQLRPNTVLFLDDNPMNLAEAEHYVPGIQIGDEKTATHLLASKLCIGKDDQKLSRLKQYKLLEERHKDAALASDNVQFLKQSHIRVQIEYDIGSHLDRAIELINRTNQLNFTKRRLSEVSEEAAAELTELLSHHWVQAGLIRVVDNYGDYGFCGFYALSNVFEGAHLVHFCFSCRILNMGVEQWVYARLGRPPLHVVGDVLADLKADFVTPDWISYETNANVVNLHAAGSKVSLGGITARGGCDLSAITHYFAPLFEHVVGEFSVVRNGIVFRTDHSLLTAAACRGLTYEEKQVFQSVGYVEADFTTDLTTGLGPQAIRLLSFLGDAYMPVYRHRSSGARVPISGLPVGGIAALSGERRSRVADIEAVDSLRDLLEREFEYEGVTGKDLFQRNVLTIMDAIPDGHIVVVEPNDSFSKDGTLVEFNPRLRNVNDWLREVMNGRDGLSVARLQSFVAFEKEAFSANHFDRMVYFRFFQWLCESVCSTSRNGGIAEQRVAELGRHV